MSNTPISLRIFFWLSLSLLAVLPLLQLIVTAFAQPQEIIATLRDSSTLLATQHSLITAVCATFISLILGSLFAYLVVLTDLPRKPLYVFGFMLPMMIPPQVTALAWLQLFGPASPLLNTLGLAPPLGSRQPLYSASGISLLMGIQHTPLVFLALRSQLIHFPRELIEAGRIFGANGKRLWLDHLLPLSRIGLISGGALAFISALGNFGIAAMLGIPVSYYTLPTLIYQKMAGFGPAMLIQIATLAMCIGLLTVIGITCQQSLLKRAEFSLLGHTGTAHRIQLGRYRWLCEVILLLILLLILIIPLIALLISSVVPALGVSLNLDTLTFYAYREILTHQQATIRAFKNSLYLAGGSVIILMLVGLLCAYQVKHFKPRIQLLALSLIDLPYALPGVVLSIACILLFVRPLPLIHLTLYSSIWIIFIAYLMRFCAMAIKPIQASLNQLPIALEQAAQLAGAGTYRRLKDILFPLVAPAMSAGGVLVFLTAVNELTLSALLWSAGNETLGVMIYNLESSGLSIFASALAVLVVCLVAILMLLLNLLSPRLPQGVIPWHTDP